MERGLRGEVFVIALLLVAALIVRLPLTDAALFEFAPMRQFYSALTARAIYFDLAPTGVSDARRAVVDDYMRTATRLEPPVIETVAALAYTLVGREDLRIPIALSWAYWLAGGVSVYAIARTLANDGQRTRRADGMFPASIALVVYLFLPYTITATRTFQPDAPALMFMLASIYLLLRHDDTPSRGRFIAAALCGMAALFIRLMTGFFLYPVFGLLMWRKYGLRRALMQPQTWLFIAISATPTVIYYVGTVFATLAGRGRLDTNFAPSLFAQASFWEAWGRLLTTAFPAGLLIAAAAGVLLWRGRGRWIVAGLWIGYALYGAIFNFHISTHPYYQTLFVPAVALGAAGVAARLARYLPHPPTPSPYQRGGDRQVGASALHIERGLGGEVTRLALVSALTFALVTVFPFSAVFPSEPDMIPVYQAAGRAADHSLRTIAMTDNWATPLRYYGEVAGQYFPTRYEIDMYKPLGDAGIPELTAADRIAQLAARMNGVDFFIVTDLRELDNQPDLRAHLEQSYPIVAAGAGYVVYDLRANNGA